MSKKYRMKMLIEGWIKLCLYLEYDLPETSKHYDKLVELLDYITLSLPEKFFDENKCWILKDKVLEKYKVHPELRSDYWMLILNDEED